MIEVEWSFLYLHSKSETGIKSYSMRKQSDYLDFSRTAVFECEKYLTYPNFHYDVMMLRTLSD